MKYDYIYSEAVDIISARKDEGTKFFTRDTLCLIVTENDKLFSSFNHTDYVEGKLVNGSSVKAALEKMSAAGETKISGFIIMNCVDMVPVLPEKEDIDEIVKLDKFNSSSNVISPNNKYIMVKDLADYDPEGDNSAIEILKVDITAKLDSREKKLDFNPDFNAVTDDGKSETKFLFAMPGSRNSVSGENPAGAYRQEDVVNQYQPVDGIPGMGIGYGQVSDQFNRSQMFSQPFMQQGMMNPQYMQQGMMNPQYMQQGMMNPQYMQQGEMNPQNEQQSDADGSENEQHGETNSQFTQQGEVNPQFAQQGEMNPQFAQQGEMNPQYMQQGMMNPQYMQQGMMNPQYMQQGMMNPQYMQQGMMNPQYMQQGMMYMPGGMMPPQYPPYGHANGAPPQFEYPENYKGKKQ